MRYAAAVLFGSYAEASYLEAMRKLAIWKLCGSYAEAMRKLCGSYGYAEARSMPCDSSMISLRDLTPRLDFMTYLTRNARLQRQTGLASPFPVGLGSFGGVVFWE